MQKYIGRNIYGILRAPRGASTESIVLSVPYRSPRSIFPSTLPGLAIMFQIAQFFRRKLTFIFSINLAKINKINTQFFGRDFILFFVDLKLFDHYKIRKFIYVF